VGRDVDGLRDAVGIRLQLSSTDDELRDAVTVNAWGLALLAVKWVVVLKGTLQAAEEASRRRGPSGSGWVVHGSLLNWWLGRSAPSPCKRGGRRQSAR